MNILQKMKEREIKFEQLKSGVQERENTIRTAQTEIGELTDAMKHIQGEHSMLVELGKEAGLIDENNNIIQNDSEDEIIGDTMPETIE